MLRPNRLMKLAVALTIVRPTPINSSNGHKSRFMDADSGIIKEFNRLTSDIEANWLEDVKDRNIDAKAALQELRQIARSL